MFLSSPKCPHRLWGPFSIIFNRCRKRFAWGWSSRGVKLITCFWCQDPDKRSFKSASPCVVMAWAGTTVPTYQDSIFLRHPNFLMSAIETYLRPVQNPIIYISNIYSYAYVCILASCLGVWKQDFLHSSFVHESRITTLTEVFPRFFFSCKANARV